MKIPVNKGNYSMESAEREAAFHKYLSLGWEKGYEEYRKHWVEYPLKQHVADYPCLVDLELSTICNLKCKMCYTTTTSYKTGIDSGLMDFKLFKKIIDEIKGKVHAIRLSLRGEPTLHPRFIDCIKYAKDSGIEEISTLTNGSMLTSNFFKKVMDAGIDWITISVDGLNSTYESIRKPLKFKDMLKKIKEIKALKEKHKRVKPVIKIQAVWPAIRENVEKFYNTFAPYVDLIAFNPLIDYLGNDKSEDIIYEEGFICPQPYQRLVIASNGRALMCANDEEGVSVVGDARRQTIHDIWHGKELNRIRHMHERQNRFFDIPACKKCYLPRKTEEIELASVNGRKFAIPNYVNRGQVIGE